MVKVIGNVQIACERQAQALVEVVEGGDDVGDGAVGAPVLDGPGQREACTSDTSAPPAGQHLAECSFGADAQLARSGGDRRGHAGDAGGPPAERSQRDIDIAHSTCAPAEGAQSSIKPGELTASHAVIADKHQQPDATRCDAEFSKAFGIGEESFSIAEELGKCFSCGNRANRRRFAGLCRYRLSAHEFGGDIRAIHAQLYSFKL